METRQRPNESQADWIRRFVRVNLESLSTRRGDLLIVRAGDVSDAMCLFSRMPNICQALRGRKFQDDARLQLLRQSGPKAGRTAEFVYRRIGVPRP